MRSKAAACLAAVLATALSGCGTLVNCANPEGKSPRAIYGGVRLDARNGMDHLNEAFSGNAPSFSKLPKPPDPARDFAVKTFCAGCGIAMLAVDLPVSAVADTLTLPVTVPSTLMQKQPTGKGRPHPNQKPKVANVPPPPMPSTPTLPTPP